MSIWEANAAFAGYVKAHATEAEAGLSAHEAADLAAWVDEPAVWH